MDREVPSPSPLTTPSFDPRDVFASSPAADGLLVSPSTPRDNSLDYSAVSDQESPMAGPSYRSKPVLEPPSLNVSHTIALYTTKYPAVVRRAMYWIGLSPAPTLKAVVVAFQQAIMQPNIDMQKRMLGLGMPHIQIEDVVKVRSTVRTLTLEELYEDMSWLSCMGGHYVPWEPEKLMSLDDIQNAIDSSKLPQEFSWTPSSLLNKDFFNGNA